MKKIKKIKNSMLKTLVASSSLALLIPNTGDCLLSSPAASLNLYSEFDSIIYNLLNCTNQCDLEGIDQQLKQIAKMLKQSDDTLMDSHQFLSRLVNVMNIYYGTQLTLSELLQTTRESMHQLQIPENEVEDYLVGLDLIELHQQSLYRDSLSFIQLAKHHKKENNFWTWLSIATVAAAAVTVCIIVPQAAIPIINGAVEIGKTIINK